MKKIFILCVFFVASVCFAKEYKVNNFVFDFEDGWQEVKSQDPNSALRIEKNGSYIEFIRFEEELSDFYLNSKLNEQRQSIENNGFKPTEIKTYTIHYISKIYYFMYDDKKTNIIGLFTYSDVTYSFLSSGVNEEVFKKLIFSFRKEGEKIEVKIPKPKPKPKPVAKKDENRVDFISVKETEVILETTTISSSTTLLDSTSSSLIAISVSTPADIFSGKRESIEVIPTKSSFKIDDLLKLINEISEKSQSQMFIQRKPINKFVMAFILIVWLFVSFFLKGKFSKYTNLKIKPYPKEMPPDFLFPFIVTRLKTSTETLYQLITRNNQFLSGIFNHNYKKFYTTGIKGIIWIHVIWSLSYFVKEGLFEGLVLSLPFGSFIFSFIEFPFIALILYSVILKSKEKQKLSVFDSQTNLLCEIFDGLKKEYIIKDGKGKEVLKVIKKGDFFRRIWEVYDEDKKLVLTIKDEHPEIWIAIKMLGNSIIKKRCYLSIYVEDKIIGFLFLDPNSYNGYQVHFDYDYFRIVNPVQLTSLLLYIISREPEQHIIFL